jgi:amidase
LSAREAEEAEPVRAAARRRVEELLAPDGLLVLPAAAGPAPPIRASSERHEDRRARTLRLTSIANLAGAPAISLPLASCGGFPLGVCLVGPRGADERLLEIAARLAL